MAPRADAIARLARMMPGACVVALAACTGASDERTPSSSDSSTAERVLVISDACVPDTTFRHDDPLSLVEEWARRDAEGPMEREDVAAAWTAGALACTVVQRVDADHYEIITAFRVRAGPRAADSAIVYVERTRAYVVERERDDGDVCLADAAGAWTDTVRVERTAHGWRIARHDGGAHRLPRVALAELARLSDADRARLRELARASGG